MNDASSELKFDEWSWHDNIIYGLQFDVGDAFQGYWRHNLIFDIDYIVEWVKGGARGVQFKVAPATLAFHDVTDLRIGVDFGDSDSRTAINELSIAGISRTPVDDKERFPNNDYYRWRIELNVPQGGEIVFGARGFTQTLRADPVVLDEQRLPAGSRPSE